MRRNGSSKTKHMKPTAKRPFGFHPSIGGMLPALHTHVVFFNLTETQNGEARALQPHELYRSQQFATAVYRSELALRLKGEGYEIEKGKSGQPEIAAIHVSISML